MNSASAPPKPTILIRGGRILDPANGRDEIGDVWIAGDRIVSPPSQTQTDARTIDANGAIVMAGGIDLHTHIGGGKLTIARSLLHREIKADPAQEYLPTAAQTARKYLDMGYTTCLEPAVIPCNARAAHAEMADVRGIDTGGYCLMGNEDALLAMIGSGVEQPVINAYVAAMVNATQCLAVKVVNPGGINAFKFNGRTMDVDTPNAKYGATPGDVIRVLTRAVDEIGLAHPLHVHASNLGVPGNIESTLATIDAADGHRLHLTHAQFHSYSKTDAGMGTAAVRLAEVVNANPNLTIDVGQIMFGQTVTISADSMHQYDNLPHARPRKGAIVDIECEAGCGVVPFQYRRRQFVHALQWAIGLELFLMVDDPNRVFLTTDHPNGGPFTSYPHLIRLLGDRTYRETALAEIHGDAVSASELPGIDRQYSLGEIARVTRSAPASILGLHDRGHLAAGGIADVVVYDQHKNLETMFAEPRVVIRRGQIVRQSAGAGSTLGSPATFDEDALLRHRQTTLKATPDVDPIAFAKASTFIEKHQSLPWSATQIHDNEMETIIGSHPEVVQ